ncbi:MAG: histidine phosphatase family protein [Rhodospirillales bacterium]|jgi:phosphohistidine phosphatase|nr:histidine phosphatase family protein [Rhodospirillales bacterium]
MKTIYLLRHAKSSWKDPTLADFDRPLNKRGKRAAKNMAVYLGGHNPRPELVLCSAAKRTVSTLEKVQAQFDGDLPAVIDDALYHADASVWVRRLRALDDAVGAVMIVGHNPGMEELAHFLAGSGDEEAYSRMAVKFPTAALAVLQTDIAHWRDIERDGAQLIAFVSPHDLE